MSKRMVFVVAILAGIGAGLLGVKIVDGLTAPRDARPVEITQEVTLSPEAWEQLEEILNR